MPPPRYRGVSGGIHTKRRGGRWIHLAWIPMHLSGFQGDPVLLCRPPAAESIHSEAIQCRAGTFRGTMLNGGAGLLETLMLQVEGAR